jgi:hypothetical protein
MTRTVIVTASEGAAAEPPELILEDEATFWATFGGLPTDAGDGDGLKERAATRDCPERRRRP